MADNTNLEASSNKDVVAMDRRLLEQMFMMMLIDSVRREEEVDPAGGNGDYDDDALKEIAKEGMNIMRTNQSTYLFQ